MTKSSTSSCKPKAYSYVRFSTPEQQKGDSYRRQMDAAKTYAATHDLDLQDASFQDLGVSAYRGANAAETGRLNEFLVAVEHGDIPQGSYLLVESLDRISRQKPRKAVSLLTRICEAGISLVTLDDGRLYTDATLHDDPVSLLVAMLVAVRAHEESRLKGTRVAQAWAKKRQHAADKPLTSICPGWLRLKADRTGFDVLEDRAAIVRRVFDETLAGRGQSIIATTLNRENVPVFGRARMWHRTYIAKMLADPSTIGTYTPHRLEQHNGKKVRVPTEPIEGYFPAVIQQDVFEQVTAMSTGRGSSVHPPLANILGGLARCPACGLTMSRISKGPSSKAGKPYLICTRAKNGAGCKYQGVRLDRVESAILRHADGLWATQPSPDAELQEQWERARIEMEAIDDLIERYVAAIGEQGHSTALLEKLRDTEAARDELRKELAVIGERIADTLTNRVEDTLTQLTEACRDDTEPKDIARINALLRQLFDNVVVDYTTGELFFNWRHAPGAVSSITFAWVD